jgi:hypothetical protein
VIASYQLEVNVQTDVGAETEPNETDLEADAFAGTEVCLSGGHQVQADSDYFEITLGTAASVRAEIIEGGAETCESNGIDSRLTLYNASLVQLLDDDDEGRGYCSKLDGTGLVPLDVEAHDLAAGTYYVQVRASTYAQMSAGGQFDYRLCLTLR